MFISLNLTFKRAITLIGAFSSENPHLLKVKLPLQNDQRWLVFKISRGSTPETPFQTNIFNIQSNIVQSTQIWLEVRYSSRGATY